MRFEIDLCLFCPQPSGMQMNSFVWQGLKPEQHPTSQNPKWWEKKKQFSPNSRGKHEVCLMFAPPKRKTSPWSSESKWAPNVVLWRFLLEQEPTKPEKSKSSMELRKIKWARPDKKPLQRLCRTFSQNIKQQNPDAIGIKQEVSFRFLSLRLPEWRKWAFFINWALSFWCGGLSKYMHPPDRSPTVKRTVCM